MTRELLNYIDSAYQAVMGNIGTNMGVAAPMTFFPFSDWKVNSYGHLHGQRQHAVEFFVQSKVVVKRWLEAWSREF